MLKITIITTAYNHENFIWDTIQSILDQSFSDWEMLIGVDNSPDSTYEIAKKYSDKDGRIQVFNNTKNLGIVWNMKYLVDEISKDSAFVVFLEGDDMITPDYLQRKIEIFNKHPDVALVYNNLDFIDAQNNIIWKDFFKKKKIPFYQNKILDPNKYILHETWPISSWSTGMIRKNILDEIEIRNPINNDLKYSVSDYDFYFQIATKYTIYGIQDSLTLYRRHEGNLSGQYLRLFDDIESLVKFYYQENLINKKTLDKKISWIYVLKSVSSLYNYKKKTAYKYLISAMRRNILYKFHYKIFNFWLFILPKFILNRLLRLIIVR